MSACGSRSDRGRRYARGRTTPETNDTSMREPSWSNASAPSGTRPTNRPMLPLIAVLRLVVERVAHRQARRERGRLARREIRANVEVHLQPRRRRPEIANAEPGRRVVRRERWHLRRRDEPHRPAGVVLNLDRVCFDGAGHRRVRARPTRTDNVCVPGRLEPRAIHRRRRRAPNARCL